MAVRRVRRVIRRFDPWTVLKVSLVFNAIAALVFVLGLRVMWALLLQRGIPSAITDLFDQVRITFTFDGETWGRVITFLAVVWAIAATAAITLGAVLYNLIADLVGGVEITVLEESYTAPNQATPPRKVRAARSRAVSPVADNGSAGNGSAAARSAVPAEEPAPAPSAAPVPAEEPAVKTFVAGD